MPLERKMQQNEDNARARGEYDAYRIIDPSKDQKKLTEIWILPYMDLIKNDVATLREEADRTLKKDFSLKQQLHLRTHTYPIGYCGEIRDRVFNKIQLELYNKQYKGLQALRSFIQEGGLLLPLFGIINDGEKPYFHNAIQIGSGLLDVANDTVDKNEPPIVFYPDIRESPFKNIESFEDLAAVAESYWDCDIYPNIYVPAFSPILPMLVVKKNIPTKKGGRETHVFLESHALTLQYRNFLTEDDGMLFGLAHRFIFKSTYTGKKIPPQIKQKILSGAHAYVGLEQRRPDIFSVREDPERAEQAFASFSIAGQKEIPEEYGKAFINASRLSGALTKKEPLLVIKQ